MNPKLVYPDPTPTHSREELEARLSEAERLLCEARGELAWGLAMKPMLARIDAFLRPADSADVALGEFPDWKCRYCGRANAVNSVCLACAQPSENRVRGYK